MDISIRTVEASRTAVVAGPLDLSRLMPSYDAVYAWLRSQTAVRQVGQNVALYRGDRMEVGVEVDTTFERHGDVVPSELPGGRVAWAVHTTGYADMARTYDAIHDWCIANGHEMVGTQWEIYGDPDDRDHVDVVICYLLA